ncbi:MAG: hydrolase [Hyphomicrobiaceae bacterium]
MTLYKIDATSNSKRKAVEEWLWGLDLVGSELRSKIVTAWVTTWSASPYERLEDMPFSAGIEYPLMHHVNEVTKAGVDLAKRAAADWKMSLPNDLLVPILILHDVDKPLMYVRKGSEIVQSTLAQEIPHGVVGGMLLKELGFGHEIISVVTTHSPKMPFHNRGNAAYVLHYADMFSADHASMTVGRLPSFQRHG